MVRKKRHHHDGDPDSINSCPICRKMFLRRLIYNAIEGMDASLSVLRTAVTLLKEDIDAGFIVRKKRKMNLSPEERKRRSEWGNKLAQRRWANKQKEGGSHGKNNPDPM